MELIRVSPRFGVLLGAMVLSLCFMLVDILSVTNVLPSNGLPNGLNPFWKLSYIFKCLTDTIVRGVITSALHLHLNILLIVSLFYLQVLDDFKTALDRLQQYKLQRMGSIFSDGVRGEFDSVIDGRERKGESPGATRNNSINNTLALHRTASLPFPVSGVDKARDWTDLNEFACIDLESALHIDDIARPRKAYGAQ